jgi:ferrochelatase
VSETTKKKAVVLVNLGTPESPDAAAVRRFLKPFLSDRRVVEVPRPIWMLILHGFILPFRPASVAKVYQELWQEHGDSPLRIITVEQEQALQRLLGDAVTVRHAMTYGAPGIQQTIEQLQSTGHEQIVVIPMYPQYSASTTAAVYDQLARYTLATRDIADVQCIKYYYDHVLYRKAMFESVERFWQDKGKGDHLLMSYHGIPKSYVDKGDPYQKHCIQTSENLASDLNLNKALWSYSFQSRLGRAEWLKPYTIEHIEALARQGVKKLDVVCPSFSADCIETLDEIINENGEVFKAAGGEELRLIPCLNSDSLHIELLAALAQSRLG